MDAAAPRWVGVAVALGVGLLVGLERERRKGRGPQREAAGLRSFALVTVAGALAQSAGGTLLVAVGALAVAALAALAYWRGAREPGGDPGLTTEVALLVSYLVGVWCVLEPAVGAASGALLAALLAARERMHRFATEWLSEQELRDALVLAGVALVVVPLAPAAPLPGLGGLALRTAAWLVLLILAIQAAAHVARRVAGERHALMAAGLLGGFVSSTATIATLGARARAAPAQRVPLAGATTLSGAATWLQALALAAVASPALLASLAPACVAGAAVAGAAGVVSLRHRADAAVELPADPRRPLRLREALAVAALLLAVSIAVDALRLHFGEQGLFAGAALAALADAHAPVAAAFGLHARAAIDAATAQEVLLVAIGVNSASRCVVAALAGGAGYAARVAPGLLGAAAAAAAVLWLLR